MARGAVPIREKEFLQAVVQYARLQGWVYYHPWVSIRSAAGFPDLVLVRPPRVLFVELKTGGRKPTPAQQHWLAQLGACPQVEVYLWTPDCWAEIEQTLRR
ncbi:MAG: hypothetical protein KatS3mg022_1293 [Armatimonadota bacterium]|nr:MAG: hypothetical protein KatS3mg022_1293 [Armatimonadota bacterium]